MHEDAACFSQQCCFFYWQLKRKLQSKFFALLLGALKQMSIPRLLFCDGFDMNKPLWGTFIYSDDSNICKAARHAGAISGEGGVVTVVAFEDLKSYNGSTRNGVTSGPYGYWPRVFIFQGISPLSISSSTISSSAKENRERIDIGYSFNLIHTSDLRVPSKTAR